MVIFLPRLTGNYLCCRGLHTMIVQFVILLWLGFNHVKILDWNVNKSASHLYINAPKVEGVPPSVFYLPCSCKHQINTHTWQLLPFFSMRQQCFYFRQKLLYDSCSLFFKLEREPPLNIPPLRSYRQRGLDLACVADTNSSCNPIREFRVELQKRKLFCSPTRGS
jgi:hypothetical protein